MKRNIFLFTIALLSGFSVGLWADGWEQVQPTGDIPVARIAHTMVEIGGKAYLFGGMAQNRSILLNDLSVGDPEQNKWAQETPVNAPPPARNHHAAVAYNNKMYVFFGQGNGGLINDVWVYDPSSKRWEEKLPAGMVPEARASHSATVFGNRIFIAGGKTYNGTLKELLAYSPEKNTFESMAASPNAFAAHKAVSVNEKMYVYGGADEQGNLYSSLFAYDPARNVWESPSAQGVIPLARYFHTLVAEGTRLWAAGGKGKNSAGTMVDLADIWEFDTLQNKWTKKTDGPAVSMAASITVPKKDEVNVFQFGGSSNGQYLNQTWKYIPDYNEPNPIQGIENQIGALGKGRFALYTMKFEQDQPKVKVDLEWAEDKAVLKLFALRIPWMFKHQHPLHHMEDRWDGIGLNDMRHFQEMKVTPQTVRGRKVISVTFQNVKKGDRKSVV